MLIGFLDLDFWWGNKSPPNLELMQTYQYFYNKNHMVSFINPSKDLDRPYKKIFCFKDNIESKINRKIDLSKDNIVRQGYGFIGRHKELIPEIQNTIPCYLPYDSFTEKLSIKSYDELKNSSLIRVSTNNFGDYKRDRTKIYISDVNFTAVKNSLDFLDEYKKHSFSFFYPLKFQDKDLYLRFNKYSRIIREKNLIVDFDFDYDFFKEFYNDRTLFIVNDIEKYLKLILFYKKQGLHSYVSCDISGPLLNQVNKWRLNKKQISFVDYCEQNKIEIKEINNINTELRLLLKANPKTISYEYLRF